MIKHIDYCFQKRIVASIFCDPDDSEKHYTGYVEKFNESEILIAHISPNGYYDGYVLRHISDVYRIDYGSEYEKKIEKLYKVKNQRHTFSMSNPDDEPLFFQSLEYAKENKLVVSLILSNSQVSGWVNDYNNDTVCLGCIDDNGFEDGISVVRIDDVLILEIDTEYEQNLKILCG